MKAKLTLRAVLLGVAVAYGATNLVHGEMKKEAPTDPIAERGREIVKSTKIEIDQTNVRIDYTKEEKKIILQKLMSIAEKIVDIEMHKEIALSHVPGGADKNDIEDFLNLFQKRILFQLSNIILIQEVDDFGISTSTRTEAESWNGQSFVAVRVKSNVKKEKDRYTIWWIFRVIGRDLKLHEVKRGHHQSFMALQHEQMSVEISEEGFLPALVSLCGDVLLDLDDIDCTKLNQFRSN